MDNTLEPHTASLSHNILLSGGVTEEKDHIETLNTPNIVTNDIYYHTIPYNTPITHIFHISDIHIRLQARHTEYREVFKQLYSFLKMKKEELGIPERNTDIPVICFITGDILHSKTELLPECIELTREFFQSIASIMNLLIILGNHDLNINNDERLDGLTPIYNGISKEYPIHYLEQSGVYRFSNILFSVSSVRDYLIIPPELIENPNNCLKIVVYHGRVNGALLYNGMSLEGEINKKTNKTITPSSFSGYDFGLFGDIHKYQFVNTAKTMGYSGSLIQQNHGETMEEHGVLLWDLEAKTGTHYHIANDYGYVSLHIKDSKPIGLCIVKNQNGEEIHSSNCKFPKNIHLRILLDNTPNSVVQKVIALLKQNHTILDVTYQDNTKSVDTNFSQQACINIMESSYQNKLIEEYLKENSDATTGQLEAIKQLNTLANQTLSNNIYSTTGTWKLIKLEFSNLYSYGSNNVIDFKDRKGIVGIIAPNHMGKSALLDIILFTLYDKFSRKGTLKDIINNRKDNFHSKIVFQIGEWEYVVEKAGSRTSKGRTTSKIQFYRINHRLSIKEPLGEDSSVKTKATILKYIGSYEDMIQTNISLQHNNCNFIDAENTSRRKELERILRIDFIDELIRRANSMLNEKKAVYKHLQKKCVEEEIIQTNENISKYIKTITQCDEELREYNHKLKDKELEILTLNQKLIPNVSETLEELRKTISCNGEIKKELELLNENIKQVKSEKSNIAMSLKTENDWINLKDEDVEDKFHQLEEKHKQWEQNKQEKIKEFDNKIEQLYRTKKSILLDYIPDSEEIELTREELNDNIQELKELDDNLVNLENIKKEIENIDKEIIDIQTQISKINQDNLPNEILDYVESISVFELEENMKLVEDKVIFDIKKLKLKQIRDSQYYNEWLNSHRDVAIFHYLEDYQDKIEQLVLEGRSLNKRSIELTEERLRKKMIVDDEVKLIKIKEKLTEDIRENNQWIQKAEESEKIGNFNNNIDREIGDIKRVKMELIQIADIDFENAKTKYQSVRSVWRFDNKIKELELKKQNIEVNGGRMELLEQQEDYNIELEEQIEDLEIEKTEIISSIKEIDKRLNIAKSMFVSSNTKIDVLKGDINEMKTIEKGVNIYQLYLAGLKGIPYILIDKIRPVLEKKINDLLSVTTNFMVKIEIDGTRIEIYLDRPVYNGKLILLNNASGFERFISSLAIRLALLEISQLPKANFMAIDEGWNSFDYNNINNVRTIFDFLVQKFDFILSISHIQTIREHCNQQIRLKKNKDGYSVIYWE